jgi:magnesium-transporting ATPase (P-type)
MSAGRTSILFAIDGKAVMVVGVTDPIKPSAKRALTELRRLGIQTAMISGDNRAVADAVGKAVGIDRVFAEVLPGPFVLLACLFVVMPSGCGKTTVLRCLNRMNDLIAGARVSGSATFCGVDLYDASVSVTEVRRRIGMVFQKSNPFPRSIYDNVDYGARINGTHDHARLDALVEKSLRSAALWDEVKDRLQELGARPLRWTAAHPALRDTAFATRGAQGSASAAATT